jgi:hypothetical protein
VNQRVFPVQGAVERTGEINVRCATTRLRSLSGVRMQKQVLIIRTAGGYRAIMDSIDAIESPTLEGLGARIESLLAAHYDRPVTCEYLLSREIAENFPACPACGGTGRVDADPVTSRFVKRTADLDITPDADLRVDCPACHYLRVVIPHFWGD